MARKKAAAHHGGAWKVAYADFVTAMMALFMVLWICSQDKEVLIATSQYFQSPFKSPLQAKAGLLNFDANKPVSSKSSSDEKKTTESAGAKSSSAETIDLQFLNSVAKDVYKLLNIDSALADKPIEVQVTSDGLRITLFDRAKNPLFEDRTSKFTSWGDFVMQSLAWMIDRNQFHVVIEGHTRAGIELPLADYTAWELSADRANAARRALVRYAVEGRLIERVTGYADTRPVPMASPSSESNQRVTMSLRLGQRAKTPAAAKPPVATPAPGISSAPGSPAHANP